VLSSRTNIDTEKAEITILDNLKTVIITKNTEMIVFWNTDEYAYRIIATNVSEKEILNIIKSMKYKK
jgi:hypothetical protein